MREVLQPQRRVCQAPQGTRLGEALPVQRMWEKLQSEGPPRPASKNTHWREAIHVPYLWKKLQQGLSLNQASEDPLRKDLLARFPWEMWVQPFPGDRLGEALLSAWEDLFQGVSLTCPDLHHLFPWLNEIPQAEPVDLPLHLEESFCPKYNLGGGFSLTRGSCLYLMGMK